MDCLSIEAECRSLTPMVTSGASHDADMFEIRAAEVKYGLRFWWRVFQPEDDPKQLFKKEAGLFGHSKENACPFLVRVSHSSFGSADLWKPGDPVDQAPSNAGSALGYYWGDGMLYTFFPISSGSRRAKKDKTGKIVKQAQRAKIKDPDSLPSQSGKPVLKPGKAFHISILFVGKPNPQLVGDVLSSLWLFENFGGIGGRTRRGAGCFSIESLTIGGKTTEEALHDTCLKDMLTDVPRFVPTNGEAPERFLGDGIQTVCKRWHLDLATSWTTGPLPGRTCFRPGLSVIQVLKEENSHSNPRPFDLMEKVSKAMKNFRNERPYEEAGAMHSSMARAIDEGILSPPALTTLRKAWMGLPITYNFRKYPNGPILNIPNTRRPANFELTGGVKENRRWVKGAKRRASPLLISYHQQQGTSAYGVLAHLPAQLLPDGQELLLRSNYRTDEITYHYPPPDHGFAQDLLNELYKQFTAINPLDGSGVATTSVGSSGSASSLVTAPPSPDEALVRLEENPARTGSKILNCTRIVSDGSREEPGWTVKAKDVISLGSVKKGDLLIGRINPENKTRLNDLRRA